MCAGAYWRALRLLTVAVAVAVAMTVGGVPIGAQTGPAYLVIRADGQPVRWHGGRPIRVLLNVGDGHRQAVVRRALATVSLATGIPFQVVGDTDFVPRAAQMMPHGVWGRDDRNAPFDVIVAAVPAAQTDLLGWPRRAATVSRWTSEFLHAVVIYDPALVSDGWGVGSEGSVLLHEFGHLMGLAHVADRDALMYATDGTAAFYTPAEWAALGYLGRRGVPYDPRLWPGSVPPPPPPSPLRPIPVRPAPARPLPPAVPTVSPSQGPPPTAAGPPAPAPARVDERPDRLLNDEFVAMTEQR